jgi:hypothetical protein
MTHVTVEIRERAPTGALTFRERVTAPSTGRALRITTAAPVSIDPYVSLWK